MRSGFLDLRLRRIFAQTLAVNLPSQTVMTYLGMHYVRSFSADYPDGIPGVDHGEVDYAITHVQWVRAGGSTIPD